MPSGKEAWTSPDRETAWRSATKMMPYLTPKISAGCSFGMIWAPDVKSSLAMMLSKLMFQTQRGRGNCPIKPSPISWPTETLWLSLESLFKSAGITISFQPLSPSLYLNCKLQTVVFSFYLHNSRENKTCNYDDGNDGDTGGGSNIRDDNVDHHGDSTDNNRRDNSCLALSVS